MAAMITDDDLRNRILGLLKSKKLELVRKQYFPFSSIGTLARIRDGKFPKSHRVRFSFGLLAMVTVIPCANCGGIHAIRKCSPKEKKIKRTASVRDIATAVVYIKFLKGRIVIHAKNN